MRETDRFVAPSRKEMKPILGLEIRGREKNRPALTEIGRSRKREEKGKEPMDLGRSFRRALGTIRSSPMGINLLAAWVLGSQSGGKIGECPRVGRIDFGKKTLATTHSRKRAQERVIHEKGCYQSRRRKERGWL